MERLDPAVHHLGKPGDVGDVDDRQSPARSALAVPPVETSSTPRAASSRPSGARPGLIRNTQNCTHIFYDSVDNDAASALPFPRRWRASVVSRGRGTRGLFLCPAVSAPRSRGQGQAALAPRHCKAGQVRCVSQARSSGSTTPRVTDSSSATAAAMCSSTSRRSRETASGRSRRARRWSSKSLTVPKGPQAGNVTKVS